MLKNKVLIIRFSSFGDIVQCSSILESIRQRFDKKVKNSEIHWATRKDFEILVNLNLEVDRVWAFDKKLGLVGLLKFAFLLRNQNYTHIYDAHNNLRSFWMKLILMTRFNYPKLITRSKDRWKRILLFKFRINNFPKPFIGVDSYLLPLTKWEIIPKYNFHLVKWNFKNEVKEKINSLIDNQQYIVLVPSAAWEMKRWPLSHWKKLIEILPEAKFMVLGGREDHLFCEELVAVDPLRVQNQAGKLSLVESCYFIKISKLVVSADTGLLHVANVLGVSAISLMGPTAFGFTTGDHIKTLEVDLSCRPCTKDGRGKCSDSLWQRCMIEIEPIKVASAVRQMIRE